MLQVIFSFHQVAIKLVELWKISSHGKSLQNVKDFLNRAAAQTYQLDENSSLTGNESQKIATIGEKFQSYSYNTLL